MAIASGVDHQRGFPQGEFVVGRRAVAEIAGSGHLAADHDRHDININAIFAGPQAHRFAGLN